LPFRPFFLAGAAFASLSIALWALVLSGQIQLTLYGGAYWWHLHEMLFGFSSAIVMGFLLTAVKNWTGLPGLNRWPLAGLFLLWLSARVLMIVPMSLSPVVLIGLDLGFLPVGLVLLMRPIVKAQRWRNLVFLPILIAMIVVNGIMHVAAYQGRALLAQQAAYLMVMVIAVLIAIMAGRVFPMFTANGTRTRRVENLLWLERTAIGMLALSAVVVAFPNALPTGAALFIMVVAASLNGWRALRWRPHVTVRTPLLWSLHLAYALLPLSLLLFAIALIVPTLSRSLALHTLTIGTLGLMMLSMITRVSLGHTGRLLTVDWTMTLAFVAILFAFLCRVPAAGFVATPMPWLMASAVFWCLGFTLFVLRFWHFLSTPRPDGQPG
jgi:uncharacterized protein involved in response to NO